LYLQSKLQKTTQPLPSTAFLPSSTATTKSNEVEETSTSSNHPKDLATPELIEADTTSTSGVFNLNFYNNLIF
jgi:hypothetical protein